MKAAYRKWRNAVDKILVYLKGYSVILMLCMLVIAFLQVVRRYVMNSPWVWSDEIVLLMLAWFSYPALVFNIWTDDHFNISSLYEKFPVPLQIVCDVIRHVVTGVFCGILGYFGWKLMMQYWPKPMPASGWTQGLKYIPVLFGGAVSAVFCVSNLIGSFIERPKRVSREEQEKTEKEFAKQSIREAEKLEAELKMEGTGDRT